MLTITRNVSLSLGLALWFSSLANAADAVVEPVVVEVEPHESGWVFSIAPYFWAAGLNGDVGLFGRQPVDIDMSFSDIFDNLRFGGMIVGEAHNGTWGVLADAVYVKTEIDKAFELRNFPATVAGNIQTSSFTGTIMGQYRILDETTATFDLMAGARIWSVDNDISLRLTTGEPIVEVNGSDGATWVDPMVGIKGRVNLNPSWYLTGWGMVGGGTGADIDWDVLGGVGYQWTNRLSVVAGYRALGVNYDSDGFIYDVVQQGPVFGTVFNF